MSNSVPIEFNRDDDEFSKVIASQSGSTATPSNLEFNSNCQPLTTQFFEKHFHQEDDEFEEINQQLNQVLLDDKFKPSLIQAFQVDMSSYLSHDKLTKNSRRMQQEYQLANIKEKEYIFNAFIRNNIEAYTLDKYMHYILEKIIEFGPASFRNLILDKIFDSINRYVRDLYACKVMQKGLEIMTLYPDESKTQIKNYTQFILQDNHFMRKLYVDKIGNQIIQKGIELFDGNNLSQLLQILSQYILNSNQYNFELSTDQYGCLIVNKIIDVFPKLLDANTKSLANQIIIRAIENSSCLTRRQFANYIIQQILEKGQEVHKRLLMDHYLIKDFVSMSMDKYGSNVAEKAIVYSGTSWRQRLWEEEVSISESSFRKLVNDQYANYPIQRLYEYLEQDYREEFLQLLKRLHESNFLNHHGTIVMKFAFANQDSKSNSQKFLQTEKQQITYSQQTKPKQNIQQQNIINTQQQQQYQQQLYYQQYLQNQQQQQQQQKLLQSSFLTQQDYQQYQMMMMQQMMIYQQQLLSQFPNQNYQYNNSQGFQNMQPNYNPQFQAQWQQQNMNYKNKKQ